MSIFEDSLFYVYMYDYVSLCALCICRSSWDKKKKLDPLELEFTKHCDAITWEPVLGPLQEQQLLATERSPQL